jgi:hypothetical protein
MSNKRRVFLTIHHRNELSLGENRRKLRHGAYHWGILVSPKRPSGRSSYAYDVTDGVRLDPDRRLDLNPDRNWYFRESPLVNPEISSHLLVRIMIGKVPHHVPRTYIEAVLESIPLPSKKSQPQESCITWIKPAIKALQDLGLAEQFDIDNLMDYGLGLAQQRMTDPTTMPSIVNYTRRPM